MKPAIARLFSLSRYLLGQRGAGSSEPVFDLLLYIGFLARLINGQPVRCLVLHRTRLFAVLVLLFCRIKPRSRVPMVPEESVSPAPAGNDPHARVDTLGELGHCLLLLPLRPLLLL